MYDQNIFGSLSIVFSNLQKSLEIFRKINVRERSSGFQNNFGKSSEIFKKWSKIFGKVSKTPSSVCLYNKNNVTCLLEDMNFMFLWQRTISHLFAALTHEILFLPLEHKNIFLPPCNILYIFCQLLGCLFKKYTNLMEGLLVEQCCNFSAGRLKGGFTDNSTCKSFF